MLDVTALRRNGVRLARDELNRQRVHTGDFVLDTSGGARRLRIKSPWAVGFAPIELYEPVLISANAGRQMWRGFERDGEQGVVQEWLVQLRRG